MQNLNKNIVVIRGGGDIATGVIQKFFRAGYKVLVLESAAPTAIRRSVSVSDAIYSGFCRVEDVSCRRIDIVEDAEKCWRTGEVPIVADTQGESILKLAPGGVVDAILAKQNLGTHKKMAPVTIGLGPGFCAGKDVLAVIETMRGHNLGRLILQGSALANTGIPGEIGGKSAERVVYSPLAGIVKHVKKLGDVVQKGDVIFTVDDVDVKATFTGLMRGLINENHSVPAQMKIADIDPRIDVDWHTISDKARCIGGAALEAYMYLCRNVEKLNVCI